jgi:hypothetical protein
MRLGSPTMLAHDLVRGSFVPPAAIQHVRELTRTRKQLVREVAQHTLRIQKTLEDANIKLTGTIADILGQTGRAILEAPVAGETGPRATRRLGAPSRQSATGQTRGDLARTGQRVPPLLAQGAPGPSRCAACRHRAGRRATGKSVGGSDSDDAIAHDDAGRRRADGAGHRRRDRHRHESLPLGRAPGVVGGPLPALGRKRRQAAQHAPSARRAVAQGRPRASRVVGLLQEEQLIIALSFNASKHGAGRKRPSSQWQPRCSPPPTT